MQNTFLWNLNVLFLNALLFIPSSIFIPKLLDSGSVHDLWTIELRSRKRVNVQWRNLIYPQYSPVLPDLSGYSHFAHYLLHLIQCNEDRIQIIHNLALGFKFEFTMFNHSLLWLFLWDKNLDTHSPFHFLRCLILYPLVHSPCSSSSFYSP
jgi:hypothetical protein